MAVAGYVVIDQLFIRGKLVEIYNVEVIRAWDNAHLPVHKSGAIIYRASVMVSQNKVVDIICEYQCVVGSIIKVEKYKPIFGWKYNYYGIYY